jgi:hypothetical protein
MHQQIELFKVTYNIFILLQFQLKSVNFLPSENNFRIFCFLIFFNFLFFHIIIFLGIFLIINYFVKNSSFM